LKKSCYFLTLSVSEQLTDLFQNRDVENLLKSASSDSSAKMHSQLDQITALGNDKLLHLSNVTKSVSLSCSIDGVPVFNSSKISMWPILISVNEIPITMRSQFMTLHSLWFGPKKP
jgi:hypothetical protein